MRLRKIALGGVMASMVMTLGASFALAGVFYPKSMVLENGLEVVVIENDRAPVVTNMVWYKVGAMDEPPGKSGIAHYLEHLMFKATDRLPAGEFSKIVAANGGRDNAFTSQDYTGYFQSIASDRLELVMSMEADRMVNLKLDADVIEPERQVVLEERQSRVDDNPGAAFGEEVSQKIYRVHPYGIPIIGWEEEIRGITLDDLNAFYKTYYAPNNAILVVAGDAKAEEVFALAKKHFGPIPSSNIPDNPVIIEPEKTENILITKEDARVKEISWTRRYMAPSSSQAEGNLVYALEILNEIIGGGNTARLYRDLVIDQGIAVSAGSWYSSAQRGPAEFGFYAQPNGKADIAAIEAAIDQALKNVMQNGVSADELQKTVVKLQDAAILANDSLSYPARALGAALSRGRSIADVEEWPDRIAKVSIEDIKKAAQHVFENRHHVTAILEPKQ